jgi:hypothetical protein
MRPARQRVAIALGKFENGLAGVDDARMCNLCTWPLPTWEALIGLMLRRPKTDLIQSFTGTKSPPSKWTRSQFTRLVDEAPTRNAWVNGMYARVDGGQITHPHWLDWSKYWA